MLRHLSQGWRQLSKAAVPSPIQAEWTMNRQLFTSSCLTTTRRFDRLKDLVRQRGSEDAQPNTRMDSSEVSYDKLRSSNFPTQGTFSQVFNGIVYDQLPIIHIKATSNNTIITATDSNGVVFALQSAGTVGFRNARRGTNVAAQAAGIALAGDVLRKDIKTARVCLKGIGPGRLPALKALQLTGVDVVSITDNTPLPHNGNRPKKVRRL